jgi:hypothetical protein
MLIIASIMVLIIIELANEDAFVDDHGNSKINNI